MTATYFTLVTGVRAWTVPEKEQVRVLLSELRTLGATGTEKRRRQPCFSRSLLSTEPTE